MALVPAMAQAGAICSLTSPTVTCAGGTYGLYSVTTAAVELDLLNDGSLADAGDLISPIQFTGTTTVSLTPVSAAGSIPTELYDLLETAPVPGGTATLIAGIGAGAGLPDSTGSISYDATSGAWNSVLDVYFELTIPDANYTGGQLTVSNYDFADPADSTPMVVTSYGFTQVPPQSAAYCLYAVNNICAAEPNYSLALYDVVTGAQQGVLEDTPLDPGGVQGIPDYAHHYVVASPEPGTMLLFGSALFGVALMRRAARRRTE
jgi:hypothetical protein